MLTDCPHCQTRYDLDERLFRRRGRRIRCAACQQSWYQLPPDSRKAIEVAPLRVTAPLASVRSVAPLLCAPSVAPVERTAPAASARPSRSPAPLLRGLCVAASVGAIMLMIGQRDRIVKALPAAGPVYAAVGLPVNLRGLEFRDIKSTILSDNGQRTLAVEGVIAQVGRRNAVVPDVRVAVRDPSGRELYSWTTPAPKQKLNPGETALFRARLAAPPVAGAQIRVQFAEAQGR